MNTSKIILIILVIIISIFILSKPKDKVRRNEFKYNCHSSYSGCLNPKASDYDCAGGSGNGPYYTGKIRVIGPDVFGLDRDGDDWGCE